MTSHSAISARPVDFAIAAAALSRGARLRPQRRVTAPICAKVRAIAAPMPLPAPVTIATWPCSGFSVTLDIGDHLEGGFGAVFSLVSGWLWTIRLRSFSHLTKPRCYLFVKANLP